VGQISCGLGLYRPKNYEHWLRVDKVIAMNTVCSFFGPPGRMNPITHKPWKRIL